MLGGELEFNKSDAEADLSKTGNEKSNETGSFNKPPSEENRLPQTSSTVHAVNEMGGETSNLPQSSSIRSNNDRYDLCPYFE